MNAFTNGDEDKRRLRRRTDEIRMELESEYVTDEIHDTHSIGVGSGHPYLDGQGYPWAG
ncbi:hypothetical protein QQ045_017155 [Rhodiola kirilowii]